MRNTIQAVPGTGTCMLISALCALEQPHMPAPSCTSFRVFRHLYGGGAIQPARRVEFYVFYSSTTNLVCFPLFLTLFQTSVRSKSAMSQPIWHTARGYGPRGLTSRTPPGSECIVARFGRADCRKLRDVNLFSDVYLVSVIIWRRVEYLYNLLCTVRVIPYSDRDRCSVIPMFDGWAGK